MYGRDPIVRREIRSYGGTLNTLRNGIVPKSSSGLDMQGEGEPPADVNKEQPQEEKTVELKSWWQSYHQRSQELKKRLVALGPAAVLAYGLFDGVSYTIAFAIAFIGYEAKTGLNPTQNVADIVKICVLMWAGNNVTRPFRLAGAAALAPFMDKIMEILKEKLKLPNKLVAFFMLTFLVASICLSIVGALVFSRWIQG
eukprot:jgi/Picsp_1/527/NSC_00524-R1_protein